MAVPISLQSHFCVTRKTKRQSEDRESVTQTGKFTYFFMGICIMLLTFVRNLSGWGKGIPFQTLQHKITQEFTYIKLTMFILALTQWYWSSCIAGRLLLLFANEVIGELETLSLRALSVWWLEWLRSFAKLCRHFLHGSVYVQHSLEKECVSQNTYSTSDRGLCLMRLSIRWRKVYIFKNGRDWNF